MATPLAVAQDVAAEALRRLMPYAKRGEVAGSIRRQKPMVKDIELVVEPARVPDGLFGDVRIGVPEMQEAAALLGERGLEKAGRKYVRVPNVLGSELALDLFLVHGYDCTCDDCAPNGGNEWGPIFTIRTGSAAYSEWLVTKIKGRLWRCIGGHVVDDRGRYVPCHTEEAFFEAAGVKWCRPEERTT